MDEARRLREDVTSEATPTTEPSPTTEEDADGEFEYETTSLSALNAVKLRREETRLKNQQQNLKLRKGVAYAAMWAVGLQMLATNFAFGCYLKAQDFSPEPAVMISWMTSTVVQVVGIALVVAKGLFPHQVIGGRNSDHDLG